MPTLNINNLGNAQAIGWSDAAITRNAAGIVSMPSVLLAKGTITADSQVSSSTVTWNNAAITFTAEKTNVTDTASNAASLIRDWQVGGTSKVAFGKGGTRGIGSTSNFGIRIQNGVDALYLSADNAYISSIVASNYMSLYASANGVGIGGPQTALNSEAIVDPNGMNLYRGGIIFGRHAGQTVNNPPNNQFKSVFLKFSPQLNNDDPSDLEITGQAAATDATTMLVGGNVEITGGAGASASSGDAHGGDVILAGGTGYGTGRNGVVIISALPTSNPGLGILWNNAGTPAIGT